ncbi:MAG: folate-binding protein YgfZ [Pirellulales bacterium]
MTPEPADWRDQYHALVSGAGLVDLGDRTQIEIAGADRAAWLHNLTTNEIRKLPAGAGCETFFTTVQGKMLAHALVFVGPESIVIDTVPGQAATLLAHLDHYLISERVTLLDRSEQRSELLLAGSGSEKLLRLVCNCAPPAERWSHGSAKIAGLPVCLRRSALVGAAEWLIAMERPQAAAVREALQAAGVQLCGQPAFEAARIEWGFPWFGRDITDRNLPQEVARDAQAISFVKGCYLGQETVARIDALGHVNKTLCGVCFNGKKVPTAGLELVHDGQPGGTVTSAAYSLCLAAPLALAYLKRGSDVPGTRLNSTLGEAEIVSLPVR